MARVINENNEVIAKKEEKSKKIEKKPISKSTLIVGIVLFVIAIIVATVLIVYFTNDKEEEEEKVPTLLQQYVSNYQNDAVKDLQITFVESFLDPIADYKGECYILVYDTTWNVDNEIGSDDYNKYLNIDEWLVGSGTRETTSASKSSMLDAFVGAGMDAHFFIVDYSTIEVDASSGQEPKKMTLGNGTVMPVTASPMLIHVWDGYDPTKDKDAQYGVKTLLNEEDVTNEWTEKLQSLTNVFSDYEENK